MTGYLRQVQRLKTNQLAFIAGMVAVATFSVSPAFAQGGGLAASIDQINLTMTALQGIAETGVAIVVVPFGIGFALKIAGHVLRAGT